MGNKSKTKYKSLMEEMKRITGYKKSMSLPGSKAFYDEYEKYAFAPIPLSTTLPYQAQWDLVENIKFAVFFGFNGMLAQKYSIVELSEEEITARLQFSGNKVPYTVKNYDEFKAVVETLKDTTTPLNEINFDDALNIIRIGINKLEVVEFEDVEKDEFDDNCIATCKPGNHACGK